MLEKHTKGLNFLNSIQADPSVRKRNDRDGISYADYFYQLSKINLEPANNDILFGIEKVRDYLNAGKLKIFSNCTNFKKEASNYMYKDGKKQNANDKPIDKWNHLMAALR